MDHQTESASGAFVPEENWEYLIRAEPENFNMMMKFLDFGSYNSSDPSDYLPEHDSSSSSYHYCSTDGSNSYSGCCYLDESNSCTAVLGSDAGFIPMEQQQLFLDDISNVNSDHHMPFSTKRSVDFAESSELVNNWSLKKARAATNVQKGKRKSEQTKKTQKRKKSCEYENDKSINMNNNSSEDESCESEENKGSRSKGLKLRAERGSATDPQSLYARKRRERINGRLRILQNLVPNGTKVDMGTMLEEAVQYVKFLQLQIKLLSSDELWMYAPVACNGMDIVGLDLKISQQM